MLHVAYKRIINFVFCTEFGRYALTLQRVLFIPRASVNILSVSQAVRRGHITKVMEVNESATRLGRMTSI